MLTNKTLYSLASKQEQLDLFIRDNLKIRQNNDKKLDSFDIIKKSLIAFFVELGEYANEEKAFKFWSQKQPSDLNVRLEEYIDGLHFLLSLGNGLKIDWLNFKINDEIFKTTNLVDNYLLIINYLSDFIKNDDKTSFTNLFSAFLNIMKINDYLEEDVLKVYDQKNAINFERQNNGY